MNRQRWRIALIDSGCEAPVQAARFRLVDGAVRMEAAGPDPSGHGTRLGRIIASAEPRPELLLAQVFDDRGPTSAAVVAAAIRWAVAAGADLLHLSLGLREDRAVLREAVSDAVAAGCLLVAAVPARGAVPYPAAYPGVLRATGDARCDPNQISCLDLRAPLFGGCASAAGNTARGASTGAAHVSRAIANFSAPVAQNIEMITAQLAAIVPFLGHERRM